jgi:hypothetical protein
VANAWHFGKGVALAGVLAVAEIHRRFDSVAGLLQDVISLI